MLWNQEVYHKYYVQKKRKKEKYIVYKKFGSGDILDIYLIFSFLSQ